MTAFASVPLQEVATIEREIVEPARIKTGTLFVGLENIESGGGFADVRPVNSGELASSKFAFSPRHVLYGKLRPYLAKIARPHFEGICSTDILPVLPGPNLDRSYLAWLLLTPEMVALAASRATGANLPRLSPSALEEMRIPLPPLPEQRRIAEILDKADALRAKRRAALAQLDALTQSIFLDMFGDPATNPRRWPVAPLAELCANEDSLRVPVKGSERNGKQGAFAYYGASGIIDWVDEYIFEGDRLLIGEDGANLVARATPVAFMARGKYWVNNHAHVLAENGRANLRFLEHFIEQIDLKPFLSGTAQPKLNRGNLDRIPVPAAPLQLQHAFARRVAACEAVKTDHIRAAAMTDELFTSLQHRAFRGEL